MTPPMKARTLRSVMAMATLLLPALAAPAAAQAVAMPGVRMARTLCPQAALEASCMASADCRICIETPPRRQALKGRLPTLRLDVQRVEDRWLGFDKVQHAAFSFFWTLGSQYTLVNKLGASERGALPLSVGSGALVGLAKEVYDEHLTARGFFSYRDLAADAVGLLLALGLIVL